MIQMQEEKIFLRKRSEENGREGIDKFQKYLESKHGPIDWSIQVTEEEVEAVRQMAIELQQEIRTKKNKIVNEVTARPMQHLEKWNVFYTESKREVGPTTADIKASYGIKENRMPHGSAGTFYWGIPDIYISEGLSKCIEISSGYAEELREMIKRFCRGDYGFVTRDEESSNGETRFICGDNRWMIGRYKSLYGGVVLETLYDISILYLVHEDVSDICQIQFEKFCKKYGHDSSEGNGWRINQLTYKK